MMLIYHFYKPGMIWIEVLNKTEIEKKPIELIKIGDTKKVQEY